MIDAIIHSNQEAREEADERFQLVYVEAVSLENRTDAEKK